ncbi:MAG: uroporphyrinogen decarboxylase [Clostridiales bacterium]|jgi:uroporphyrinogen decarboxylase|nr:uroporphyrinogen decarboxylase [Clostridiales bacterium]
MTKRERVRQALLHRETDIIPYEISLTQQEHKKVAEYLGDDSFYEKVGNHIESVYYDGFPAEDPNRPGFFRDDFGVVWNRTGPDKDIGVIDGFVLDQPSMGDYKMPQVNEGILHEMYERMMNNGRDTFKMGAIGFSMFERAWSLRGMENLLMDMILHPGFVDELLDQICEFNLKIIDIGLSYDIDGFHFGDDWGQQRGLIMGPKLWRRFIKPRLARMYERVKSHGKFVSQHSCGDILEIFSDLIEIGLDMYQTFQPEIYPVEQVKEKYGQNLSFWGGISTQRLLPFASPEEVMSETIKLMKTLGKSGGYVAAPTHAVPPDVPPENVVAMIDVFQNQEKYLK